jgi:acyl-coenzyme A synthetase/AMP-(fatty) acid ligase
MLGIDWAPLTHGDLVQQIENIAQYLSSGSIGAGDRVATVLKNGPEAAVCALAVSASAIYAPLNPAV